MKTIAEVLKLSSGFLSERGLERARRCAEELLGSVVGLKRLELYMQFDRPVLERELVALRSLLKRAATQEPLEYILGSVEFAGCTIALAPSVLIPRPETEILVSLVVKKLEGKSLEGKVLWDVCSGSGCIGIALKKAFPALRVVLSDCSPDALRLAEQNAKTNGVAVEFEMGDLLERFHGASADIVVCNPPYLSTNEYLNAQHSVRAFEPKLALVGGEKGTEFYERLARELPGCLRTPALVALEIGWNQGAAVQAIFEPFAGAIPRAVTNCAFEGDSSDPAAKDRGEVDISNITPRPDPSQMGHCNPFKSAICDRSRYTKRLEKDWAGKDRFFFLEIE